MAALRCEALHNRATVRGCKFQSENGPEYKKKYGGKSRAKGYHSPHSLAASILFLLFNNHLQTRSS
jgi:hypothetical protein